jgi:hypothetical protein
MSGGLVVGIFSTVFVGAVTLIVAYQHRRQLRQLELHRKDPSVGVMPPESGVVVWWRRNGFIGGGVAAGLFGLANELLRRGPPTRVGVVLVAMDAAGIALILSLVWARRLSEQVLEVLGLLGRLTEITGELAKRS